LRNAEYVSSLIEEFSVTILGGFSNGGTMALFMAASYLKAPLKGVFGLSGFTLDMKFSGV
jgi:predicted esterase